MLKMMASIRKPCCLKMRSSNGKELWWLVISPSLSRTLGYTLTLSYSLSRIISLPRSLEYIHPRTRTHALSLTVSLSHTHTRSLFFSYSLFLCIYIYIAHCRLPPPPSDAALPRVHPCTPHPASNSHVDTTKGGVGGPDSHTHCLRTS